MRSRGCSTKTGTRTGWPQHVWALELKQQTKYNLGYELKFTKDINANNTMDGNLNSTFTKEILVKNIKR